VAEIGYQTSAISSWSTLAAQVHETNKDLVWPKLIEVVDRMRREDPQVGSVLSAVTLPILSAQYSIDQADSSDEVAAFIAQNLGLQVKGKPPVGRLRTRGRFSWIEFLRLALLSLVYGHSVFEQVYEPIGDKLWLHKLAWRPPRTIAEFKVAPDGGLDAIVQHGTITGQRGSVTIPIDRLVVFVNQREGANWIGTSLLRQAYKVWLLKDRVLRAQAMTIERNGLGVPVYTGAEMPDSVANDQAARDKWLASEKESGLEIAKQFRAGMDAGASIPHSALLQLLGVTGKLPETDKPIKYYDEQIARAVLAHFLNLGGDDSTGSYALGDTLEGFFTRSLTATVQQLLDVVQQHVIEDLVDLNFGPDVPAPRIVASKIGADSPVTAEAIRALVECGALTPDVDLERYLRETLRLPLMSTTRATNAPDVDSDAAPASQRSASGTDTDTMTDAETARAAAEVAQKAYLAVGVGLTRREFRALVRRAGADLVEEPDEPEPAPAPNTPLEEAA